MIKFGEKTIAANGWVQQEARLSNLVIHLGMSPKANPETAEMLPGKVMQGDDVLWAFDKNVGGFAFLREVKGEHLIVLASREEVIDIIPILDLPAAIKLADGRYDWKRSAMERLELKLLTAIQMNREPQLSPIEALLKNRFEAPAREAAAAKAAELRREQDAEHQAREARREARRREIMIRAPMTVYTAKGERRQGRPIVGDEWQCLRHGVDCVSVERYEEGVGVNPSEHFFVHVAGGGNKSRARVIAVFQDDPTAPKPIEQMGEIVVEKDGAIEVIGCYTADGLVALEKSGLNSGAIRALWPLNDDGTATLVSFAKGGRKMVGNVLPQMVC